MGYEMIEEDEAILSQQDMQTLARWWCTLNRWEWPEEIPDAEEPTFSGADSRRWQIMQWIHEAVGHRVISHEWNSRLSDEDFNDFWRGTYEGHAPSRERWRQRMMSRHYCMKEPRDDE